MESVRGISDAQEGVPVTLAVAKGVARRFPDAIDIMGVPVVPFASYEDAIQRVEQEVEAGRKSVWVAVNPQKVYRAWHDRRLMRILKEADVGICDGIGVSIAAKILYGKAVTRCTGCDLFIRLLGISAERGWRVFLLGASPESNRLACGRLKERFPDLRIVGREHGYFEDSSAVIARINASGADLLFVAMGSPQQEYWIFAHRDEIDARFCMGVGGSLEVASGRVMRAPRLFRKTGTEFLFQLVTQPHRFRRQIVYIPYMLRALRERLAHASVGHAEGDLRDLAAGRRQDCRSE